MYIHLFVFSLFTRKTAKNCKIFEYGIVIVVIIALFYHKCIVQPAVTA